MSDRHILVVDDEPTVRNVVTEYLRTDGHRVTQASDGERAVQVVSDDPPDLVVLDVMLPRLNGFAVLDHIRAGGSSVPVIMLTARTGEKDRVTGLDLGADDYVVKPFSPRELAARVRSVLRRTAQPSGPTLIDCGDIVADTTARTLTVRNEVVETTPREFDLMVHLMHHRDRAFSRAEILEEVWRSSAAWQDPSTVTVHVRRLRSKIEIDPTDPVHLQTVWGVGYRFAA